MNSYWIDFEPVGRRGECKADDSLLAGARSLGIQLNNLCDSGGRCGACRVQVLQGDLSPLTERECEQLSEAECRVGYRLACQAYPLSHCRIHIPPASLALRQRLQLDGQEVACEVHPGVRVYPLEVTPPALNDVHSDERRIVEGLLQTHGVKVKRIDYDVLWELPHVLRAQNWRVDAVVEGDEIIALLPPGTVPLGAALDVGTTKVAVFLLELCSGRTLASTGFMNPQIPYGEDVMSRISAVQDNPEMAQRLQVLLVEALNEALRDVCRREGRAIEHIVSLMAVGNTAMHHLFLKLPVKQLGCAPYVAAVSSALQVGAHRLGMHTARGARVHCLPNVAGFVGGDHVAMLLAAAIEQRAGMALALDIGTNTEICLSNHGVLSCLSSASGPAFEGAHIQNGMRAASGAIERFRFVDGDVRFQTIDDAAPVGLCGSGIMDVLAELYRAGIVDRRGRMQEHPRVRGRGRKREFIIVPEQDGRPAIAFSQADVEQLILAKGAIRAGIEILLQRQGLTVADIDELLLAGAFGAYLDVGNAIEIGLLPALPLQRICQLGNAAGTGARMTLLSRQKREEAARLAQKMDYIELAGNADFADAFARCMRLG